jgi:hypothetical protein
VFEYCEEDVRKSVELLRAMLRGHLGLTPVNPEQVIFWSEYSAKCIAQIQARGMPTSAGAQTGRHRRIAAPV